MDQQNLFAMLAELDKPRSQDDHFRADYLASLYHEKIAKSQTAGKDGVRNSESAKRLEEETSLIEKRYKGGSYRFTTYKERLILRGPNRPPRQISIPTARDRLALRALCQVLHTYVPETRGAPPHSMVRKVVEHVRSADSGSEAFLRIDVKDFFSEY
jgi:retron-type reverse transcriptase